MINYPEHPSESSRPQAAPRPAATGPSSNQQVVREAEQAGPANYDIEGALKAAMPEMHDLVRQVHPMIMFGITIQFMKTCGGRIQAHQVIEDVYAALRLFVGDPSPDKGGQTEDLLEKVSKLDLDSIKEKLDGLTGDLGKLLGSVRPQEPQPATECKES
jgi:hypothetical protein